MYKCLLCCRDLVKRLFRLKGKGKQGTQPEDLSDPLEEVYFQTLVRWDGGPKTPIFK